MLTTQPEAQREVCTQAEGVWERTSLGMAALSLPPRPGAKPT